MKKLFVATMMLCTTLATSTAFARPPGQPIGETFQLEPIPKRLALTGRLCGKYFFLTNEFRQLLFIAQGRSSYYARQTEITFVVDQSLQVSTVTYQEESGPRRFVFRMSMKEMRAVEPCMPAHREK